MADSRIRLRRPPRRAETAAATPYRPQDNRQLQLALNTRARSWQDELWYFNRTLGELNQATDWMSRAMSLMRPIAAEVVPGGDEPEPLTEGAAAQFMQDFAGGGPDASNWFGQAALQAMLPGEWYTIVEQGADPNEPLSMQKVTVVAPDNLRAGGSRMLPSGELVRWPQVQEFEGVWRPVADSHLLFRTWKPDGQWPWLATSNGQAAVPILRRIELIDKRIVAMMVSRLASNGIMLIPAEGTIVVPKQYQQAPDPFVAALVATASNNIAEPGSASAAIPIPIRFTGDLIEKWKILKAEDPLDEELLQERLDELGRLGDTMGIARERVSGGMSGMNQWSSAVISEEEVRILFGPLAALIMGGVTTGYLQPLLRLTGQSLLGPNGGRIVAWFDSSNLTAKVDKFATTLEAYDRFEVSGTALRREAGLSDADKPEGEELADQVLKFQARQPELSAAAGRELAGVELDIPEPAAIPAPGAGGAPPVSGRPGVAPPAPGTTPPGTRTQPATRDADRTTNPQGGDLAARVAALEAKVQPGVNPRGPHRARVAARR